MKRLHRYCGANSLSDLKAIVLNSLPMSSSMVCPPNSAIRVFFKDFPLVGQTAKRAPNFYGQLLQFTYRDGEVQMLIYNLSSSRSMKLRNQISQNNLQTARFIPKIFSNKFTFFVELFVRLCIAPVFLCHESKHSWSWVMQGSSFAIQ